MKQPSGSRASYSLLLLTRGWNDDRSSQGQARVESTVAVKYETNRRWVPHTKLLQCLLWSYPKAQHAQVDVLAEGYISKRCMHGRWPYKFEASSFSTGGPASQSAADFSLVVYFSVSDHFLRQWLSFSTCNNYFSMGGLTRRGLSYFSTRRFFLLTRPLIFSTTGLYWNFVTMTSFTTNSPG